MSVSRYQLLHNEKIGLMNELKICNDKLNIWLKIVDINQKKYLETGDRKEARRLLIGLSEAKESIHELDSEGEKIKEHINMLDSAMQEELKNMKSSNMSLVEIDLISTLTSFEIT